MKSRWPAFWWFCLAMLLPASLGEVQAARAGEFQGRLVHLPDGRRLNFRCTGQGAPTVLFEGGFAADSTAWSKVQPLVARNHRACAYDRAGYGLSDPGPMPRDGAAVAKDLDDGLRAAGVRGPFVLVGHSAGGLYVRLFADRRAREVVGMVLVDPSAEHQDQRFAALFGPGAGSTDPLRTRAATCLAAALRGDLPSREPALIRCTPNPPPQDPATRARMVQPSIWRTQLSELDTLWGATSREVEAGRPSYGDLPLIVLTADGTNAGVPAAARSAIDGLWRMLHREIASRSSRGVERLVTGSSHLMMLDRPDAVAEAVSEVIDEGRDGRSAGAKGR